MMSDMNSSIYKFQHFTEIFQSLKQINVSIPIYIFSVLFILMRMIVYKKNVC